MVIEEKIGELVQFNFDSSKMARNTSVLTICIVGSSIDLFKNAVKVKYLLLRMILPKD